MPKTSRLSRRRMPRTFEELCALHWPRPIHDDHELDNAQEFVDRLAVLPELSEGQEDYLETLTTLIENYEDQQFAVETDSLDPIDTLKYLMRGHGISSSDLGRLLGERSLGAKVLSGERELSKKHILILASHFAINPGSLLPRA